MIWSSVLILALIGGFLGAWAGAEGTEKNWRRIGVSLISMLFSVIVLRSIWMIFNMIRAGALSLGYGIPDLGYEKGSDIGRFWYKTLDKDAKKAGIFTRGTIGLIGSIALLAIPIVTGHWVIWGIATVLIILNNALWGSIILEEGTFHLFGKMLLWEEFLIHGIDTAIITAMVILCR